MHIWRKAKAFIDFKYILLITFNQNNIVDNKIEDKGAEFIADALKLNQSLTTLNLSSIFNIFYFI